MAERDRQSAIATVSGEVESLAEAVATIGHEGHARNLIAVVGEKCGELARLIRRK